MDDENDKSVVEISAEYSPALLLAPGLPALILFATPGSVFLDADIFFPMLSDRFPHLYFSSHRGICPRYMRGTK